MPNSKQLSNLSKSRHSSLPSVVSRIIDLTKEKRIEWFLLGDLISYLDNDGLDLSCVRCLYDYYLFTKNSDRCLIPDRTFVSLYRNDDIQKEFLILSQSGRNLTIHLDIISDAEDGASWKPIRDGQVPLMRLYNIIRIVGAFSSDQEFADLLYSISDVRV